MSMFQSQFPETKYIFGQYIYETTPYLYSVLQEVLHLLIPPYLRSKHR